MIVIGFTGITKIYEIDDADTFLYEKATLPIEYCGRITTDFNRIRVNVINATHTKNLRKVKIFRDHIAKYDKDIKHDFKSYEKTYFSEEDKKIFEDFMAEYDKYMTELTTLFNYIYAGKTKNAAILANGKMKKLAFSFNKKGENITKLNVDTAKKTALDNT